MKVIVNRHYYSRIPTAQQDMLLEATEHYVRQLRKHRYREVVYTVMQRLDEFNDAIKDKLSCKSGCSHCCHIKVECTEPEARLAYEYAQEIGYEIDREQLERQANCSVAGDEHWPDFMPYPERACVFLKDGKCAIYDFRPLICRKYNAISDPSDCDTRRGTIEVQRLHMVDTEALVGAVDTLYKKTTNSLAKHLLKLSKNESGRLSKPQV